MEQGDHLKNIKDIKIIYQKSHVDYPFKSEYKRDIEVIISTWKLQMDLNKDDKNFENKDSRRKQELELKNGCKEKEKNVFDCG